VADRARTHVRTLLHGWQRTAGLRPSAPAAGERLTHEGLQETLKPSRAKARMRSRIEGGERHAKNHAVSCGLMAKPKQAVNFYVSIFKNSKILSINRYGDAGRDQRAR